MKPSVFFLIVCFSFICNKRIVYNYACALSIDNSVIRQFDSCFKYLNIAVELDTSVTALTDPDFIPDTI